LELLTRALQIAGMRIEVDGVSGAREGWSARTSAFPHTFLQTRHNAKPLRSAAQPHTIPSLFMRPGNGAHGSSTMV